MTRISSGAGAREGRHEVNPDLGLQGSHGAGQQGDPQRLCASNAQGGRDPTKTALRGKAG